MTFTLHCVPPPKVRPSAVTLHGCLSLSPILPPPPFSPCCGHHGAVCLQVLVPLLSLLVHLLFSVLYPTREWNHLVHNFFCLTYVTGHDILKTRPCCCKWQHFFLAAEQYSIVYGTTSPLVTHLLKDSLIGFLSGPPEKCLKRPMEETLHFILITPMKFIFIHWKLNSSGKQIKLICPSIIQCNFCVYRNNELHTE